jgi:hypothetical protein
MMPVLNQMATAAAAYVEHPHPVLEKIVQQLELGPQKILDFGRLGGGIQGTVE